MTDTATTIADKIRATDRAIQRQSLLQTACNHLCPGELTRLYLQLDAIGGAELRALAPYHAFMTSRSLQRAAQGPQLQRRELGEATVIFETPGLPPDAKRLYIVQAGGGGQFFIPLAMALALLPAGPKDVLVLSGGFGMRGLLGIKGAGKTPPEIAATLRSRYGVAAYRHVSVLGFSVAGLPALRLAEALGADIALSLAGLYPRDVLFLRQMRAAGLTAFDPLCACRPGGTARLINVLASKNEFDYRSNLRIGKVRPGLIAVHLPHSSGHNVLARMAREGSIGLFFRIVLAENGVWLRLLAPPLQLLGATVRRVRLLRGRQKVQLWYEQKD